MTEFAEAHRPSNLRQTGLSETETERVSYLRAGHSLSSWLLTTDHKRIAILYLISITFFFFVGGVAAAALATLAEGEPCEAYVIGRV